MAEDPKKPFELLSEQMRRLADPLGMEKYRRLLDPLADHRAQMERFARLRRDPLERFAPQYAAFRAESERLRTMMKAGEEIVGLYRQFDSERSLFAGLEKMTGVQQEMQRSAEAARRFDDIGRIAGMSLLTEQTSALSRLAEQMKPMFEPSKYEMFGKQLLDLAAPAASLLGAGIGTPGVLSTLEGVFDVVGTVSWLDGDPEASPVHSAALLPPQHSTGPWLDIEVAIRCGLCGGLMMSPQNSIQWKSETTAKIEVSVYPVCPKCVHELEGSPEFWVKKLRELRRPTLKLIPGGAENPDNPDRARLRLVEDRGDSEQP